MKHPSLAVAACLLFLSSCSKSPRMARVSLPPLPISQAADEDVDASPMDALEYYKLKRLPEGATELSAEWPL